MECGGFAAAGRALGISQPAVTKQIRAVEGKVGYPLFSVSAGSTPQN
ncbi:MAG: LysR family transcriptional regulator [Proteobacteria bacterium]|nr:LysR family transcriptional regulator [Pseudomonadota bacterium]